MMARRHVNEGEANFAYHIIGAQFVGFINICPAESISNTHLLPRDVCKAKLNVRRRGLEPKCPGDGIQYLIFGPEVCHGIYGRLIVTVNIHYAIPALISE